MANQKHRLGLRIWATLILFVLIPVLLLNTAIFSLVRRLYQNAYQTAISTVEQSSYFLDQIINECQSYAYQQILTPSILNLANIKKNKQTSDYEKMLRILNGSNTYIAYKTRGYRVCLFFNNSHIFLSNGFICQDMEDYYGALHQMGDYTFEEFKNLSEHHPLNMQFYPNQEFIVNKSRYKGIIYSYKMSDTSTADRGGTVFTLLEEDVLENILSNTVKDGGYTVITDQSGKILYTSGEIERKQLQGIVTVDRGGKAEYIPETVFGRQYIAVQSPSALGLRIISVQPKNVVLANVNTLLMFAAVLNVTSLLLCVSFSGILARRNYKMMEGVLELLPDIAEKESGNLYAFINSAVTKLADRNKALSTMVDEQRPFLQAGFWDKILGSPLITDSEARELMEKASGEKSAPYYCLLLMAVKNVQYSFDFESLNKMYEYKAQLYRYFQGLDFPHSYVYSSGIEQLVLLLPTEMEEELCRNRVLSIIRSVPEGDDNIICISACSGAFSDMGKIRHWYTNCGSLINSTDVSRMYQVKDKNVLWCGQGDYIEENSLAFSDEQKNQIILEIKAGDFESVKEKVREMISENFWSRTLSESMFNLFIAKCKLTLLGAWHPDMPMRLDDLLDEIDCAGANASATVLSLLMRSIETMCTFYKERSSRQDSQLKNDILEYVKEHFADLDFSLSATAEHFEFSESYFSQVFKELAGETFSSYLERLKMKYGDQLLMETNETVDAIAFKTGYNSSNAFRRAYKRYFGISPSERRKKSTDTSKQD